MTVIGEVNKKAIDFTGFISPEAEPVEAQDSALRELLEKARHTAFGMKYRFGDLLMEPDLAAAFQLEMLYTITIKCLMNGGIVCWKGIKM